MILMRKRTNLNRRDASGDLGVGPGELQDPIPCMSFYMFLFVFAPSFFLSQ